MTMHPYIGGENIRERQREIAAEAERRRLARQLSDMARVSRRGEAGRRGRRWSVREHYLVTAFDTDDESRHLTEAG
jgi:hypothetical protein